MRAVSLFLWVVFFNFSCITARSQEADPILYSAHYIKKHVIDKAKPKDTLTEDMLLLIGAKAMLFTSYNKLTYGYETESNIQRAATDRRREPGKPFHAEQMGGRFTLDDLYFFGDTRQHFVLGFLMDRYLFQSEYSEPKWYVSAQQKEIIGMTCQKATSSYQGREWTAWFCSDIPAAGGPWKLRGLPGLIVVAHDQTGEVSFNLTSLELTSGSQHSMDSVVYRYTAGVIALPTDQQIQKVKESEFLKLKQLAQTNFSAYFDTRMRNNGLMDNPFSVSMAWRHPVANPIALAN